MHLLINLVNGLLSDSLLIVLCASNDKGTICSGFSFSGETLLDERINGGAFIGTDGLQFPHKLIPVSSIYSSSIYINLTKLLCTSASPLKQNLNLLGMYGVLSVLG